MNEQVKKNIMEYKQKYLQKLADAQVPEKLEKQLEEMDWTCLELIHQKKQQRGTFAPLQATELSEIRKKEDLYRETGLKALREGKVGAILLAGGQGTRLGFDKAKGMFNIGVTKTLYIFEQLIKNLMQVKHEAGVWIPLYIMTSEKNDVQTRTFFEEHDFFGYDSSYVKFFVQEMVPAVDFDGNILMESEDSLAMSPNGNGGWFKSMLRAHLDEDIRTRGIEWLKFLPWTMYCSGLRIRCLSGQRFCLDVCVVRKSCVRFLRMNVWVQCVWKMENHRLSNTMN